jgi:DNA-binding NarL/FixJ family response regulator
MTLNVAVVDDHDIFRQSLALLLSYKSTHRVVGDFASIDALLNHTWQQEPDCALLDYHLAEQNSLQALSSIRERWPSIKVVFLTGSCSLNVLRQLAASGAEAIVHKRDDAAIILEALNHVDAGLIDGEPYVSVQVSQQIQAMDCGFTLKELEVLHHLLRGLTPNDISDLTGVSRRTVEKHKENMMRKSNFHSMAQLLELGHRLEV